MFIKKAQHPIVLSVLPAPAPQSFAPCGRSAQRPVSKLERGALMQKRPPVSRTRAKRTIH
jgi:hypothetical protein